MQALEGAEHETIIKTAMFTGMREGELLGLQWSCVDFDRGIILVNKQMTHPREKGDTYRLASLKNDKPRKIQPAPYVMDMLKKHKIKQMAERLRLGAIWNDEGFPDLVFTGATGAPLSYQILTRHYKKALEAAQIEDHRFHDLRHPYVKHTTKIFSLRLKFFQAQPVPDALRKTRGAFLHLW
ncbi:MAG: hypothetical protein E7326_07630, partial [Clostridiales bacterium]|nr:hypothetical protein [Clostridiales bacterium]